MQNKPFTIDGWTELELPGSNVSLWLGNMVDGDPNRCTGDRVYCYSQKQDERGLEDLTRKVLYRTMSDGRVLLAQHQNWASKDDTGSRINNYCIFNSCEIDLTLAELRLITKFSPNKHDVIFVGRDFLQPARESAEAFFKECAGAIGLRLMPEAGEAAVLPGSAKRPRFTNQQTAPEPPQ